MIKEKRIQIRPFSKKWVFSWVLLLLLPWQYELIKLTIFIGTFCINRATYIVNAAWSWDSRALLSVPSEAFPAPAAWLLVLMYTQINAKSKT